MFLGVPVLLFIALAAWRMSNILAHKEKGPFRIFWTFQLWARRMDRKSAWFKKSEILEGIGCEYCNSLWFGIAFGVSYRVFGEIILWMLLPLAISTLAIIIKHLVFMVKSIDTYFDLKNKPLVEKVVAEKQPIDLPAPINEYIDLGRRLQELER